MYRVSLTYFNVDHHPEAVRRGTQVVFGPLQAREKADSLCARWFDDREEAFAYAGGRIIANLRSQADKLGRMLQLYAVKGGPVHSLQDGLSPDELAMLEAAARVRDANDARRLSES